jgi:hypothetical protein
VEGRIVETTERAPNCTPNYDTQTSKHTRSTPAPWSHTYRVEVKEHELVFFALELRFCVVLMHCDSPPSAWRLALGVALHHLGRLAHWEATLQRRCHGSVYSSGEGRSE